MVSPKPPRARIVSQWNSSSDSVPSAWLWQFVSGASIRRLAIAGPWRKVSGSNRRGMDSRSVKGAGRTAARSRQPAAGFGKEGPRSVDDLVQFASPVAVGHLVERLRLDLRRLAGAAERLVAQ